MPGTTVFVVGTGPLLDKGSTVMSGQCLRTWHFVEPMLAAGHKVHLYTIPIPGATADGPIAVEAEHEGLRYHRCNTNDRTRLLPFLEAEHDRTMPAAIVAVNAYPASLATHFAGATPLWADLYGWNMAEGQIRSHLLGNDRDFGHFWRTELEVILGADRFSAVTERQQWAMYGEMAMTGRLDHRNAADELIVTIPSAVHPAFEKIERAPGVPAFLKDRLPDDARICLWSGGFNSWTDTALLVGALEDAINSEPRFHFVATGGPVIGHEESTWKRFLELADRRLAKGRWHMLGWCDFEQVLDLHRTANVGLCLDARNIEALFGARTRLTNMLGAGLPVITTRITEISEWIALHKCGSVVELGDREGLAKVLIDSCRDPRVYQQRGALGRDQAQADFSPRKTIEPVLRWLESPTHAADKQGFGGSDDVYSSTARLRNYLRRRLDEPVPFASAASHAPAGQGTARPTGDDAEEGLIGGILKTFRKRKE